MKKIISFLIISIFAIACFTIVPTQSPGQNIDGWFCTILKLNAVGTHANIPNVNRAGAGIWGTDTTLFVPVASPNYNATWWSVSCYSSRVGTGTTSYIALKASYDGTSAATKLATSVFIAGDSSKFDNYSRITNANSSPPFYKWTITNSGNSTWTGSAFPYPYMTLYILKGNDSTTVSCYYHIERKYAGK